MIGKEAEMGYIESRMRRVRRLGLPVVLAALSMAALPAAASAGEHPFHAHMDAHTKSSNCGPSEWSDAIGYCTGTAQNGNAASAGPFQGYVTVKWADAYNQLPFTGGRDLPSGYDRWMELRKDDGSYLLGAVKMPNGPFHVVTGAIHGHPVHRDSGNLSTVEHTGGPLFLWVGFHSTFTPNPQAPAHFGYVFGLRGWLRY
jgi:hypothetical protein